LPASPLSFCWTVWFGGVLTVCEVGMSFTLWWYLFVWSVEPVGLSCGRGCVLYFHALYKSWTISEVVLFINYLLLIKKTL